MPTPDAEAAGDAEGIVVSGKLESVRRELVGVGGNDSPEAVSSPALAPSGLPEASGGNAAGWSARVASSAMPASSVGAGVPSPARMTMTKRRLELRPAAVSFDCAGRNSPKPITDSRAGEMPPRAKRCTTLAARAEDSSQFDG